MRKRLLKALVSFSLIITCLVAMFAIVNAETKNFNVTASNMAGVQSPDPLTPRALKADNEHRFYVTVNSMDGTCTYVRFIMNRYTTVPTNGTYYTYPDEMYYYRSYMSSSSTKTQTQNYGNYEWAPANYYYFMKCIPQYGYAYINVTGKYTP